ncbi:phosphoenolpyruvate carboxykinase [Trifolium pratense]|uniref:Phosphoenolpyruvate carboxykinase n=1 Tax=Trifolium pratense TaxID=57577 RepID=A0A2K3KR46_TRIPR|nr:phosphoenolpyruvate carboxykinase [Trifolium pratense]
MADKETTTLTENGSSDFSFSPTKNATSSDDKNNVIGRRGLPMIQIQKKAMEVPEICHDDSTTPVKAQTIEELHSLQKKRSTPNTPIRTPTAQTAGAGPFANVIIISEEDRQRQQLQSIRYTYNATYYY